MLLQRDSLRHLNAISHEGKVVVVATDADGKLFYTVRQDGFEDSYLSAPPDQRGWESWQVLELPNEPDDASVLKSEKEELTYKGRPDAFLCRSLYRTFDQSAVAPVQLVSALDHVYVFRQSRAGTLLADRFVLDGMTNKLSRKLQVRFKRSREKNRPSENMKAGAGGLMSVDTLDFRDTRDEFFYEPTTELCLVNNLQSGWFSIVLVPTGEHERYRWHIFSYNAQSQKIEIVSLRASEEGLFEVRDQVLWEPKAEGEGTLVPRTLEGVCRRTLEFGMIRVTGGPTATRYNLQEECELPHGGGKQLVRTATRLMLAVPTSQGTAALSFALTTDGTLSQIASQASPQTLRSTEKEILLPLTTLDNIRAFGDATPTPTGTISGLRLGTEADGAEDRVVVASAQAAALGHGDVVQVTGTRSLDGVFKVEAVSGNSFNLAAVDAGKGLGSWEKKEQEEGGLYFDGMVTEFAVTTEGKLRITALNHGLESGDEVQLLGTRSQDDTYPISKLDDGHFVIERTWPAGEAVNVRLESRKRRGLVLDGTDDYVTLPAKALPRSPEISICLWARGGARLDQDSVVLEALDKSQRAVLRIVLLTADGSVLFRCGMDGGATDQISRALTDAELQESQAGFTHWAFTKSISTGVMNIYRNGLLWHSGTAKKVPLPEVSRLELGRSPEAGRFHYQGTLADLSIWSYALGDAELKSGMYLPLGGKEPGLCAYYRLGAVLEGPERRVLDLAAGQDGTVKGGAYAGAIALSRRLRDNVTDAVKYGNQELFAVTQGGIYEESFEFRVLAQAPVAIRDDAPLFRITCWGRRNRSARDSISIPVTLAPFKDLGGGWYAASGRYIIPPGVTLARSFEIADVKGTWDTLEIRRHRVCLLSDTVTEARYVDAVSLREVASGLSELEQKMNALLTREARMTLLLQEKADIEAAEEAEALKREIDALKLEVERLQKAYESELASPLNYECTWQCGMTDGWKGVHIFEQKDADGTSLVRYSGEGNLIRCVAQGNGLYYLSVKVGSSWKQVWQQELPSFMGQKKACLVRSGATPGTAFKLVASGDGTYAWDSEFNGSFQGASPDAWDDNRLFYVGSGGSSFKPTRKSDIRTSDAIDKAKTVWEEKKAQLDAKLERYSRIQVASALTAAERTARIAQIDQEVQALDPELRLLSSEFVEKARAARATAPVMPELCKDARGLTTTGALLPFVRPTGRLFALETCEGNVELSYFDERGRMRRAAYDACADSRNTTYEQWLPEAPRTCINLTDDEAVLQPDLPINLGAQWSLEAWFYYPLPPREWNSLTSSGDGDDNLITVLRGQYLGLRSQGYFFNSGYSLSGIAAGWHHVAAVKRIAGGKLAVDFYLDGKNVRRLDLVSGNALSLDGVNDHAELVAASLPAGGELTVSFWARGADSLSLKQEALVLEALDSNNRRILAIGLPGAASSVRFEGGDASGVDLVEWTAPERDLKGRWTHWAFTKNAARGRMRIYKNGGLCKELTGKSKSIGTAAKFFLGKAAANDRGRYAGDLTELAILSRELGPTEILERVGTPWTGKEDGLRACFLAEPGQGDKASRVERLRDLSPSGRSGTIAGDPPVAALAFANQCQITLLGNRFAEEEALDPTQSAPTPVNALGLDGTDDYVEFPAAAFPAGSEISICFWSRGGSTLPKQTVFLAAHAADNTRQLSMHLPWSTNEIYWDCGGQLPDSYDRVVKAIPAASDYKGSWVHWAFVKNATTGVMTIYRNGASWHSQSNLRRPIKAAVQLLLGKASMGSPNFWHGDVAELSIWNKALSAAEVQSLQGKALSGTEPNLHGYWKFDSDKATDRTPAGRHGSYVGKPAVLVGGGPAFAPPKPVRTRVSGEPFGRLAEVRAWEVALSDDEVAANSKTTLTGNEPGLLVYYPLNDAGAGPKVLDLSSRANHAVPTSTVEPLVMQLDGESDFIVAPDHEKLRLTTYTVEVWIRPNGQPTEQFTGLVGKPGRGFQIWLESSGIIHHRYHTQSNWNTGAPDTPAGSVKWDQWNHVAVTNDGKTVCTYIDGVLAASGPVTEALVADSTPLRIGCNLDGTETQFFRGRISDVRIWKGARTAAEIRDNLKRRLTGKEAGLIAYLPLNAVKLSGAVRKTVDITGNLDPVINRAVAAIDNLLPLSTDYQLGDSLWAGCAAPIGHPGHRALRFDGRGALVKLGQRLLDGPAAFTIEGWVKATAIASGLISLFGQNDAIEVGFSDQRLDVLVPGPGGACRSDRTFPLYEWHHVAVTGDGQRLTIYVDGAVEKTSAAAAPYGAKGAGDPFKIGAGVRAGGAAGPFQGLLAEVRVFGRARSADEIRADMYRRLTGKETGLLSCLPLDDLRPDGSVVDLFDKQRQVLTDRGAISNDTALPLAPDSLVSAEYSTIGTDPVTRRKVAIMRRFLAAPAPGGALLLPDKRIESLDLRWIGNCQFAPTLLGFIEGAPPVPSENLTVDMDYRGATSVELVTSQDVELRWDRAQDVGGGLDLDIFLGYDSEAFTGIGQQEKTKDVRAGFKGSLNTGYQLRTQSSVSARSSQRMTDRLELRGSVEQTPKFPHLGTRFVPKNVGYALVISGMADMFVSRLSRSGKMVGYQVLPVDGIPPDVNTITFMMNPAYTMQGSLDGLTGSRATTDRFFKHVPQMRAQYGALYPASYYRLQEAYDLKQQIENDDKRRESYFAQFNATLVDETSLNREVDRGAGPQELSVNRAEDRPDAGAAGSGSTSTPAQKEGAGAAGSQSSAVAKKQAQIDAMVGDQDRRVHAQASLQAWQKKMEAIRDKAGKRHIVNTYVWDADGGLHTEAQSFASTVEHSMGGAFTLDARLGFEGAFGAFGFKAELTALAAISLSQSMQKTESRSTGVELAVDLSGVESSGITDHDDKPLLPGEKVDRYRFMSFYLGASTNHFNDFFRYVVDPEWLRSNSEEARALRQAMGKTNKTWRVLHRVTYVERPALMGFGRDMRDLAGQDRATDAILNYFDQLAVQHSETTGRLNKLAQQQQELTQQQQTLATKVDQILSRLK